MGTVGTGTFAVARPDLSDPANIETAFEVFYLGENQTNATGQQIHINGVKDHIDSFDTRIQFLEDSAGIEPNFAAADFYLYSPDSVGGGTKKLKFGISQFNNSQELTLTISKTSSGAIVTTDDTQTLTNKTIGTSNTIIGNSSGFKLRTGTYDATFISSLTSNKNVTIPNLTSDGTFVFENHAQTLSNKTIIGYKETVATYSLGAGSTQSHAYDAGNLVYVNPTGGSGTYTVNITGMQDGMSMFIIFKAASTAAITPRVTLDGSSSGIRWAGGSLPPNIASGTNRHGLISITKISSSQIFATYLGEYGS